MFDLWSALPYSLQSQSTYSGRAGRCGAVDRAGRAGRPGGARRGAGWARSRPRGALSPLRRRYGDGAVHRERAPLPVPVEHHRPGVPRPGAQGRRLDRGREGDRPRLGEGGEDEVEEAAGQLPRRAQAAERAGGARAGRRRRRRRQEAVPQLEVHGAHAVPAAAHERAQKGRQSAGAARARRRAAQRRRALLGGVGLRARLRAQAQEQRAPRRHRPQAGLLVQSAEQASIAGGELPGAQARARAGRRRAARRARHLLQQHVPVHEALPVPHADQDQEDAVRRGHRGGGGARGGAAELREPVGARRLLVQQRGGGGRGGRQALLSRAPRGRVPPRALPLLRHLRAIRRLRLRLRLRLRTR